MNKDQITSPESQTRSKIAIQGLEGSFHYAVAQDYFADRPIEIVCLDTFAAEGAAVVDRRVDAAVMAIENSIAGSILPNYHILQHKGLKVVGEYYLPIEQCLLGLPGVSLDEIDTVSSHPIALLQCEAFLDSHPSWTRVQSEDTAASARRVASQAVRSMAAIASSVAAKLYGLDVLARGINTIRENFTRFLVVTQADNQKFDVADANKASLFFQVPHTRGSLAQILKIAELYELNMSKLQSYPIPRDPFRYNFHLDVEFSDLASFWAAAALIERHTEECSIYGVYKNGRQ